jgi:twitching motility protein PilT
MPNKNLFLQILLAVCNADFDWTDAYLQPGLPMLLRTPSGNRVLETDPVNLDEIKELASEIWKISNGKERTGFTYEERLRRESIREAVDINAGSDGGSAADHDSQPPETRLRFIFTSSNGGLSLSAVVRKIPQVIPTLEAMNFSPVLNTLTTGNGLVLVTGPTGNGKSTVAASMIEDIRTKNKAHHIVVIADPLEYSHPSTEKCAVTSRQVGVDVKDYTAAAEDAVRMAPRVIEFGEIRDEATALAALQLGESGHLVISSMQSKTVEGAISKLITYTAHRMGTRETIASCLRGVIRPALVPDVSGTRWKLAHEFVLNEGYFADALNKGEMFPTLFRQSLREDKLKRYGWALNRSLQTLVDNKEITEAAARAASNDVEIANGQTTMRMTAQ